MQESASKKKNKGEITSWAGLMHALFLFARAAARRAHVENEGGMGLPALLLRHCSLDAGQAGPGRAAGSEMEWSGRLVPLLSLHVLKRC